jgi:glycerol-1-phosphate dehydrogenase [NAD(P)+]
MLVGTCDEPMVDEITARIERGRSDLVIGFGGGKVLDASKLAAGRARIKFLSVPTILSNDGIASPVSVIKARNGVPVSHLTRPPWGVVVDIKVVQKAPIRHLRAGIGDLISNLSAVWDARLAKKRKKGGVDDYALSLAEAGPARLLKQRSPRIKDPDFLMRLTEGLAQSGLAMGIAGSSQPASGSEHKISHSLDQIRPRNRNLHGEQVGVAALFTMAVQENDYLAKVRTFYRRIGFPMRLVYLGLTPEIFCRVVAHALRIRPERYTILEERKLKDKDVLKIIKALKM